MDTDELKKRLTKLALMNAGSGKASREIAKAAEERLAAVNARLDKLRPIAMSDMKAAEEYEDLILERGRLDRLLAPLGAH